MGNYFDKINNPRDTWRFTGRYGLAILAITMATILRWWFDYLFESTSPYLSYYAAIVAVAALAGRGPGVLVTICGGIIGCWFFFGGQGPHGLQVTAEYIRLTIFLGVGISISLIAGRLREAQQQVSESEKRYRLLYQTMYHGVVYQAADGKILSMNPAAERILGKTPAEFLGQTSVSMEQNTIREDGSVFPGLEHPAMVALRTGREQRNVPMGVYNPREKCYRWIDITAVPLFHLGQDMPYQVYTVFGDITERKMAEEKLAYQANLLAMANDAIIGFDAEQRATYWNSGAERMYGLQAAEALGKTYHEFLRPDIASGDRHDHAKKLNQLTQVDTLKEEAIQYRKDGSPFRAEYTCRAIFNKQGQLSGYVTVCRDVTEMHRSQEALREAKDYLEIRVKERTTELEQANHKLQATIAERIRAEEAVRAERQRFNDVLETLPVYLVLLTPDYHVSFANRFFRERFGESQSRRCYDYLFGRSEPCKNCETYTVLETMAPHHWEWTGPDGRNYEIFDSPFTDTNGSTLILEMGIDITERKRVETELQKHRERLEDLVRERTRELENANTRLQADITERKQVEEALRESEERYHVLVEELREADRHKNEFLAMLSHELRNPLAAIRNGLSILDRTAPDSEQSKRAIAVIDRQFGQLAHLVDDLLDITRITQNKIRLQRHRLELNEFVRRIVEDQRSLFNNSGVRLEAEYDPAQVFVHADGTRLAQVVCNLLQNAVKFTRQGESVHISVACDKAVKRAIIRVRDTGEGIEAKMLPLLFQPFMQAETSKDRSRGGLGLGLALSRGLVELHGGEINAQSAGPGKGSEFVVRLPLDETCTEEILAVPVEIPRRSHRMLIIEDNPDLAESLRELLKLEGHKVEVAYSGLEGLGKAREFNPEVLLCDIGLPGMDGYAVVRAFRADEALKDVFMIALTGYAQPEDQRLATEAGFDRHMAKPLDLQELERLFAAAT